jgi:hypothetical protein
MELISGKYGPATLSGEVIIVFEPSLLAEKGKVESQTIKKSWCYADTFIFIVKWVIYIASYIEKISYIKNMWAYYQNLLAVEVNYIYPDSVEIKKEEVYVLKHFQQDWKNRELKIILNDTRIFNHRRNTSCNIEDEIEERCIG